MPFVNQMFHTSPSTIEPPSTASGQHNDCSNPWHTSKAAGFGSRERKGCARGHKSNAHVMLLGIKHVIGLWYKGD